MKAGPTLAAVLLLAACAGAPVRQETSQAPRAPRAPTLAELEDIFWNCDYVATTRGVDATPAAQCHDATRELRRVKFANSFHQLLSWWRENKPAEHEKRRRLREDPRL